MRVADNIFTLCARVRLEANCGCPYLVIGCIVFIFNHIFYQIKEKIPKLVQCQWKWSGRRSFEVLVNWHILYWSICVCNDVIRIVNCVLLPFTRMLSFEIPCTVKICPTISELAIPNQSKIEVIARPLEKYSSLYITVSLCRAKLSSTF